MLFEPNEDYLINGLTEPIVDFELPSLITSPIYYVELTVETPTSTSYNQPLTFSVMTENKGKFAVEKPEYRIFIVDSVGNIRGTILIT